MTRRVAREFLVDVASLRRQPGARRQVVFDGELEELSVSGSGVPEHAPVHVEVVLESVSGGIFVTGRVETTWVGSCRRCLEPASGAISAEVAELCVENPLDEETTYPLGRDELDLSLIAHDACILELPLAPLCGDGCLGLCPTCGRNRNLESCTCTEALDPRFSALSLLGGDGEETKADRRSDHFAN